MSYKNTTLTPAYGRDYKSVKELMDDWNSGKDFIRQPSGAYISTAEVPLLLMSGHTHIHFRYNKQQKIHVIKI